MMQPARVSNHWEATRSFAFCLNQLQPLTGAICISSLGISSITSLDKGPAVVKLCFEGILGPFLRKDTASRRLSLALSWPCSVSSSFSFATSTLIASPSCGIASFTSSGSDRSDAQSGLFPVILLAWLRTGCIGAPLVSSSLLSARPTSSIIRPTAACQSLCCAASISMPLKDAFCCCSTSSSFRKASCTCSSGASMVMPF
mmetsp:Transcript_41553/g.96736  ORF Transcript_41553/g.96736 Transcript_41553/m.96736 type:complete len:201 (-) Transcript_41553:52-654(-)